MNLNRVILIGRLAADPETRTTPNGQEVASVRIATNRVWNDNSGQRQEQVEFHSVVLWGRLAQIAGQYLKKGALAMIEGRLQTRSWTSQDNVKKYRTEIVAENLQLGPRAAGSSSSESVGFNGGSSRPVFNQKFTSQSSKPNLPVEEIPVISEEEPIVSPQEVEETTVDLKDIPF